jgi:azurin
MLLKKNNALRALSAIFGSIAVLVVLIIYDSVTGPSKPHAVSQQAGRAASGPNTVFLRGGPLQQGLGGDVTPEEFIVADTGTDVPQFVQHEFTVHSGKIVSVELHNHSTVGHQHDWALIRPGTLKQVQDDARAAGPTYQWIPNSPNILAYVHLTQPGQSTTALFRAPAEPGDYPFLCTYPGHGNAMNGTVHVLAP